jgi:hypothetical protein
MARQDLNEAFLQTSFLYGGNAAYVEDLYAQYTKDPTAVDGQWRAFFETLKDDKQAVAKSARGASVEAAELADRRQRRTGVGARRQLGPGREGGRRQDPGQGPGQGREISPGRRAAGDPRFRCAPSC